MSSLGRSRRLALALGPAVLGVLLATLLAAPAAAYVVVLKDGSRIVAEKEYEIRDGRAIITLPGGTQSFIDASEIDREATVEANRRGYGQAEVIERPETKQVSAAPEPQERQKSLAELASREPARDRLEPHLRDSPVAGGGTARTAAGYTDLSSLPPRAFRDLELAAEIQRFFRGQGVDRVELYQGSQLDRLYAAISTNSEASVFRALEVAAEALLATRESHPGEVAALELYLATPDRERAGQFVLTPELARLLVEDGTELSRFFVENVQF
ncbi:MAG TPA: hypothetical protein VMR44_01990 [Thermoanaerobaculia bacterium]|nr:hypothetical protein [Thermoanaerobaculia bacterium]